MSVDDGRRADRRQPAGKGAALPRARLHPPLPDLLALQDRARLPAGGRVVHLDGRHARADDGDHPPDPLDPRVRPGARARLAAQHGRLDDLQEALLGPGAADLRVPGAAAPSKSSARRTSWPSGPSRAGTTFEGHTPHRPWIDAVKIACRQCGAPPQPHHRRRQPLAGRRHRALLDAELLRTTATSGRSGSRPTSSPSRSPASSATGSTRCWRNAPRSPSEPPFKTAARLRPVRDEHGEEMHKSTGNAIWFDEAADIMGSDVMRWLYCALQPVPEPELRLRHRRRGAPSLHPAPLELLRLLRHLRRARRLRPGSTRPTPCRWPSAPCSTAGSSRACKEVIAEVRAALDDYDARGRRPSVLERFVVEELSNWYIRRSRRRFWKTESRPRQGGRLPDPLRGADDADRAAGALHAVPGRGDVPEPRALDRRRTSPVVGAPDRLPGADQSKIDARPRPRHAGAAVGVNLGRAARGKASAKVRQPLPAVLVWARDSATFDAIERMQEQLLDELNVKDVRPFRPIRRCTRTTSSAEPGSARPQVRQAPGRHPPGPPAADPARLAQRSAGRRFSSRSVTRRSTLSRKKCWST